MDPQDEPSSGGAESPHSRVRARSGELRRPVEPHAGVAALALAAGILACLGVVPAAILVNFSPSTNVPLFGILTVAVLAVLLGLTSRASALGVVGLALGLAALAGSLAALGVHEYHRAQDQDNHQAEEEARVRVAGEGRQESELKVRLAAERRREAEADAEAARQFALAKAALAEAARQEAEAERAKAEGEVTRLATERERVRAEELRGKNEGLAKERAQMEAAALEAATDKLEREEALKVAEAKRQRAAVEAAYRGAVELYRTRTADHQTAEAVVARLGTAVATIERSIAVTEARRREVDRAYSGEKNKDLQKERQEQLDRLDRDLDSCRRALARTREQLTPAQQALTAAQKAEDAARVALENARAAWVAQGGRAEEPPPRYTTLVLKDGTEIQATMVLETSSEYQIKDADGKTRTLAKGEVKEVVRP